MGLPGITREQMIEVDRIMVEEYHIPVELMMEHAGLNLARLAVKYSKESGNKYIVVAGSGNNGGGGIVSARRLASWGLNAQIYLPRGKAKLNEISRNQLLRAEQIGIKTFERIPTDNLNENNIFIDAYLGYNFEFRNVKLTKEVFNFLSTCNNVVSLDTPSGLEINTGKVFSNIHPTATITLGFVKIGLLLTNEKTLGDLYVADIGIPIEIFKSKIGINWNPPFLLKSLENLKYAFSQEPLQKVKIQRSQDISKFYWEVN
jgi:NAD(P)H-hydrate epimerase